MTLDWSFGPLQWVEFWAFMLVLLTYLCRKWI